MFLLEYYVEKKNLYAGGPDEVEAMSEVILSRAHSKRRAPVIQIVPPLDKLI